MDLLFELTAKIRIIITPIISAFENFRNAVFFYGKLHAPSVAADIDLPNGIGLKAHGILITALNFGTVTGSTLDSVMNSASSGMLESLNLSKYLTELGLSTKIVDMLTGPVDKVYEIVTCSGIQIFIFLAGIYSVPPDLYEAAHVEGANAWEKFWMITFPMVMPMILVNVVYSIVDTFVSESNLVMEYVYQLSFKNFNFGLSSAITWIYFAAIAAILAIVYAVISRKTFYYT